MPSLPRGHFLIHFRACLLFRNRLNTPPLSPAPQIPALPVKLCSNQLPNLLSNQRLVSVASLRNLSLLIFPNFFLTIPITSYTITSPASLRSDHLIGINRNADRHHAGTLIDFPGIRSYQV